DVFTSFVCAPPSTVVPSSAESARPFLYPSDHGCPSNVRHLSRRRPPKSGRDELVERRSTRTAVQTAVYYGWGSWNPAKDRIANSVGIEHDRDDQGNQTCLQPCGIDAVKARRGNERAAAACEVESEG